MGSPPNSFWKNNNRCSASSVTPFDSNMWLYISEKTETFAFMAPEVVERNVIMVKFTDKGIVNEVKKLDLSNAQDVKHVERVTPTSGNEVTFWDQLFHNVGRFNTGDSGLDPYLAPFSIPRPKNPNGLFSEIPPVPEGDGLGPYTPDPQPAPGPQILIEQQPPTAESEGLGPC